MKDALLPKFSLSLLVRFELTGPEGPSSCPTRSLLAYLACTAPVPQPRQKLATLLWGSHFETQAQQNLRQTLFRFRRAEAAAVRDDAPSSAAAVRSGSSEWRQLTIMACNLVGAMAPSDGRTPALAVSPQQKREMTLTALLDQLDSVAAKGPVLIVFEDVHWIDPTSQGLLDRLVARVANLSVLLVVTVRLEVQPTWVGQPHVSMLPLGRLGRRDSARIIAGVARDKALPDAVVEQVLIHTDGDRYSSRS